MAYILRNEQGRITGSTAENLGAQWTYIADNSAEYILYLESSLAQISPFRESDIQLARILEDLIALLIEREIIRFTDFPLAAQERLNNRQALRQKTQLSKLIDDNQGFI